MSIDKNFSTSNFYLATFLFAKGLQLVDIDRSERSRCKFVFLDTAQRQSLVDAFNFGQDNDALVLLDARKVISAIKTLKERLYEN